MASPKQKYYPEQQLVEALVNVPANKEELIEWAIELGFEVKTFAEVYPDSHDQYGLVIIDPQNPGVEVELPLHYYLVRSSSGRFRATRAAGFERYHVAI